MNPDNNHPIQENIFDIFLSHSHHDANMVETLAQRLEDEAGFHVWLDKWILVPGGHWQQEMAKGLNEARTCGVCIGQNTAQGWFQEEIERALNRQTRDNLFRVIPIILPTGDANLVDNFLELRTWVDFREGLNDPTAFNYLLSGILGVPPGRIQVNQGGKEDLIEEDFLVEIRQHLTRIQILKREGLIDSQLTLEYQRKLLDKMING
jgi:hypothetical protein